MPFSLRDHLDLARTLTRRAFTADFQQQQTLDEERAVLAAGTAPIADPLAQDYVAWRRAAMWVAAALLSLSVLVALIDWTPTAQQLAAGAAQGQDLSEFERANQARNIEQMFGPGNLALLDGLQAFLLVVKLAVVGIVIAAAARWQNVAGSRSLVRWAWLTALVVPLLISAWPWGQHLDFSHLDRTGFGAPGQGQMVQQQVSFAIGAMLLVTVAPKLLALFPGIVRSSLTLKTLLPQASAPGWLTVVFAPFLAGFLLLVASFLSQVQGSWVLIAGVLFLVAGPVLCVRRARDLVRPHTDEEVGGVVRDIRKRAMMFHLMGGLLLLLYVADLESLSWGSLIHLGLEAVGGILLTMVAISDVTLALLAFGHRQGAEFHGSTLRFTYEQRLEALGRGGLTDVDAALGVAAPVGLPARPAMPDRSVLETIPSNMASMLGNRPR